MRKSINFLLLLVFAFCISTPLYAQDDREKPVKVIIMRPPPHRLNQADLWNITIINSGQSVSAYLFGSMTNNENGELIATGQTMTFEVKKGTTNFKVSDLPKVPDVNYVSKDPKYKTSFMNTGGAPPGDYKICVELRYTNNSVAGEDCIEQKVIGGDAPQLISPRDEEKINNDNPIFTWMHMKAPGSDQTYTLRIVELKGDESPENAMLKNKAFFEKEGITQTMLQYPSSANKFEEGKKYVWQIYVVQSDAIITKSEVNLFTNKNIVTKTPPVTLTSGTNDCVNNNFSFFDDYSDDDPWRPIAKGNEIGAGPYDIAGCIPRSSTISSSSFIRVNGGQCVFQNVTEEGNDYRTFREFTGAFKTNFESSNCWEAKFEFKYTQLGADKRVGHPIFALTAGKWNPINYSDETSVIQSAFCNFSDQDAMMVWLWLPTTAYYNAHPEISPVPAVGIRKAAFFPWCKNGKNLDGYIPTTLPIDAEANTPYYIKLERINATSGRINVYSDPGFTNHVTNSPQCFPIPNGEEITGLNTLQHSNAPDGVARELTGTLKNTCINILNPGSISCGTTTPPSNCNSDCKLITANVSTIVNSNITLKTYIGEFTTRLNPLFSNTQSNLYGWGNQPVSPPITVLLGSKYVVKATGGMPDQWGRVYDAAYQLSGTFDLSNPPVCQGVSQFMLVNPNIFNFNTRPTLPQNYNWRYHEYLYEFQVPTFGPANVTYTNINNVAGGSGNVQAFFDFYKICVDNQFTYQWDLVGGNLSDTYLSNANISSPVFRASSDGEYIYEVKIYCNNQLVDRDTTKIYVNKSIDLQNQKYFYPTPTTVGGCGFWSDIAISVSGMTGPFVSSRHGDIINVNSSVTSIYFKTSYSFVPMPTSLTNTLFCWVYKKNNIGDPNWLLANPPVNLNGNTTSQGNINNSPTSINSLDLTGSSPGNYFWVRINPNIGNPLYPCTERNFYIKIN